MESFFSPYVRVGRCPAAVLCRAVIRRRSRRQEAGGSPVHKHCPHPCSWLLQQQALAAEIMRKMLTPVARLVAVTLASLVSTASAEGSTIVAGSKGNTTNYSHVITLHCLP